MNCPKCQKPVDAKSRFCKFCGTTISQTGVDDPGASKVHVGDMFDGKWRVESKLGQGGMGAVFLAHDVMLDRQVAIKILAAALCNDAEFVDRFEREAKLTAKLEHPNIVPIYAVGRFGARPFIVMKLLEGVPLSKRVKECKTGMPMPEILSIMRQLCDGLGFIHSKGFVHRDIKSANIHLSEQGLATILDFGIIRDTKESEGHTRAGTLMGTPHYMAPEQALGKTVDARTDLYALGCIAFEMFTGHLPFTEGNDFAIIAAHVQKPAPNICDERQDIPPAVGRVVQKMLEKSPDNRFQTAQEIYAALEKAAKPPRRGTRAAMQAVDAPVRKTSKPSVAIDSDADERPRRATPVSRRMPRPDTVAAEDREADHTDDRPSRKRRVADAESRESTNVDEIPSQRRQVRDVETGGPADDRPSQRRSRQPAIPSKASDGGDEPTPIPPKASGGGLGIAKIIFILVVLSVPAGAGGLYYALRHHPEYLPPALVASLSGIVPGAAATAPLATAQTAAPTRSEQGLPPSLQAQRPAPQAPASAPEPPVPAAPIPAAAPATPPAAAAQAPAAPESPQTGTAAEPAEPRAPEPRAPEPRAPEPRAPEPRAPEPRSPASDSENSAADAEAEAAAAAQKQTRPKRPKSSCPAGRKTSLRIVTKPTWASVSIDGKNKGDTPITLEIASGMHTIKTRRGGFKEAEKTVCVKPSDEPMVVTIEMSK